MGFCGRPSTPSNSFSQKFFYSAWAKEPITLWKYNIPMFIFEAQLQCDVDNFRKILGSKIQIQWHALCAPALVTRHQLVKSFSIQQPIEDSKHSSSEQQWFIFLEIELHSPSLWWTKRNPSSESEAQMSFAYKIQHKNLVGSVGGYFLWALYVAMHHSISANMRFVWQTPPLQLAIRKTLGRRWRQMRGPPFIGAPCMLPIFLTGHLCIL